MSECERYRELISRLLDDDLDAGEKNELAGHLKTCPECAAMYVAFRSVSECMADDVEKLPDGLHEDIVAGVRRESIKKKNRRRRPLLTMAACFAVVIIGAAAVLPKVLNGSAGKETAQKTSLMSIAPESAADSGSNAVSAQSAEAADASTGSASAQTAGGASDKVSNYITAQNGSGEGDYRKASFPKILTLPDEEHIRQFEALLGGDPAQLPTSYDAEFLVCYEINGDEKYVCVFICSDKAYFAVIGRTSIIEFDASAADVLAVLNF